jgi:sterol desaturase/sphingolipid hydroxylase (fatty acid hydroxylase superfamily)
VYPYVHKKHHEYFTSISLASEYCNPLEFFFSNLFPTALGPMLLGIRVYFFTLIVWYIVRACESIDGHCGYDFSWSPYHLLPLSAGGSYHDFHHSTTLGTTGVSSVCGTLCAGLMLTTSSTSASDSRSETFKTIHLRLSRGIS